MCKIWSRDCCAREEGGILRSDTVCFIRPTYLPKCEVSDLETHNFMKYNWKTGMA